MESIKGTMQMDCDPETESLGQICSGIWKGIPKKSGLYKYPPARNIYRQLVCCMASSKERELLSSVAKNIKSVKYFVNLHAQF